MYFSLQIHASQSLICSFIHSAYINRDIDQPPHWEYNCKCCLCSDLLYVVNLCCLGLKQNVSYLKEFHRCALNSSTLQLSEHLVPVSSASFKSPSTGLYLSLSISLACSFISISQPCISSSLTGLLLLSQSHPYSLRPCHSPLRPATLCMWPLNKNSSFSLIHAVEKSTPFKYSSLHL